MKKPSTNQIVGIVVGVVALALIICGFVFGWFGNLFGSATPAAPQEQADKNQDGTTDPTTTAPNTTTQPSGPSKGSDKSQAPQQQGPVKAAAPETKEPVAPPAPKAGEKDISGDANVKAAYVILNKLVSGMDDPSLDRADLLSRLDDKITLAENQYGSDHSAIKQLRTNQSGLIKKLAEHPAIVKTTAPAAPANPAPAAPTAPAPAPSTARGPLPHADFGQIVDVPSNCRIDTNSYDQHTVNWVRFNTGGNTKTCTFTVRTGWRLVLIGLRVNGSDGGRTAGGKTIGRILVYDNTGTITATVTDGFFLLVRENLVTQEVAYWEDAVENDGGAQNHPLASVEHVNNN